MRQALNLRGLSLLLILLIGTSQAFAGKEDYSAYKNGSQVALNTSLFVEDYQYSTMQSVAQASWGFANSQASGWIEAGVDYSSTVYVGTAYNVDLVFDVTYWTYDYNTSQVVQNTANGIVINVEYNPMGSGSYPDKARRKFADAHKITATLKHVYQQGTTTAVTIPANLYMEGLVSVDRYYSFDETAVPAVITHTDIDLNSDLINDELEIKWDYIPGAEEYDIEWTFVNDYNGEIVASVPQYRGASSLTFGKRDFELNSTRVTTTDQHYRIPLLFDHGYVIYRVRGVGRGGASANDYSQRVNGKWSTDGTTLTTVASFPHKYQVTQAHEEQKNWQVTTTFAEEGKKKEVISYFDGALYNRQTVTRNNSDYNAIVGETFYDHQGRGAVTALPVPSGESVLKYYPAFNVVAANDVYSREDFDVDASTATCSLAVAAMDSISGASRYYSSLNSMVFAGRDYLPMAKGYPFTLTEYEPDNTGRIRTQTSVGPDFTLNSGHETQYFYGQPEQEQLDRLFATEVGYSQHYKKNMVVDANGTVSVSYMDMKGKVIATALAGDTTRPGGQESPLLALKNPITNNTLWSESATGPVTVDLLNKDNANDVDDAYDNNLMSIDGTTLTYSSQKLVSSEGIHDFSYTLSNTNYTDSCLASICYPLVYDLDIHVKDKCGNEMLTGPVSTTINSNYQSLIPSCSTSVSASYNSSSPQPLSANLAVGSYTVEKVLKVNQQALDYLADRYISDLDTANCMLSFSDFFQFQLDSMVSDTNCSMTCEECVTNLTAQLGTRTAYISGGANQQEQDLRANEWDAIYNECMEPCKTVSICQAAYDMMLQDVSPNGQYGNTTQTDPNGMALSVFNTGNVLPHTTANPNPNWKYPVIEYADALGQTSYVTLSSLGNGAYDPPVASGATIHTINGEPAVKPEDLLNVSDFLDVWDPNWAKSLVSYHPEYGYFQWCDPLADRLTGDNYSSDDYDYALMTINTFSGAQSASIGSATGVDLTNVATIVTNDPFFKTGAPGAAYATTMSNKVSSYYTLTATSACSTVTLDMGQFAAYTLHVGGWYGNDHCNAPNYTTSFGNDAATEDDEWKMFRSLYLSEKAKLMQQAADAYMVAQHASSPGTEFGYNGCIGADPFNAYSGTPYVPSGFTGLYSAGKPIWTSTQICSYYTYPYYSSKQRRFGFADLRSHNITSEQDQADYGLYQQTGLCPNAIHLQHFIKEMGVKDKLKATGVNAEPLRLIGGFTPRLYMAVSGITNTSTSNYVQYVWDATVSGSTLNVSITDNGAQSDCALTLTLPASFPSGLDWTNYATSWSMSNVLQIGPTSATAFNLRVQITSGSNTYESVLSGTVCSAIDLNGCSAGSFADVCVASDEVVDLQSLMNILSGEGNLTNTTGVNLANAPYNTVFNDLLSSYLPAGGSWYWKQTATDNFTIYDNSSTYPNDYMTVVLTPTTSITYAGAAFTNIKRNSDYPATDANNNFKVDVAGQTDVKGKFTVTRNSVTSHIAPGTCDDQELQCQQPEQKYREDLLEVLNALASGDRDPDNTSGNGVLTNTQWFSHRLQSFLATAGTETFITAGTISSTVFNVPIKDNTVNATPVCTLELTPVNSNTSITDYTTITSFSGLEADENNLVAGQAYEFTVTASLSGGGTVLLRGSSCFPIKNCKTCQPSPAVPYDCATEHTEYTTYLENNSIDGADFVYDQEVFCDNALQNCSDSYTAYLTSLGITSGTSPYYISLTQYCQGNYDNCSAMYASFINTLTTFYSGTGQSVSTSAQFMTLEDFCAAGYGDLCLSAYSSYLDSYRGEKATALSLSEFCDGYPPSQPCDPFPPAVVVPPIAQPADPCSTFIRNIAAANARAQYEQYKKSKIDAFKAAYIAKCMNDAVETFTMTYTDREYHFTLYYYDQAGNLVRTVPPAGVTLVPSSSWATVKSERASNTRTVYTSHKLESTYGFNSLNQLMEQTTPDGGSSDFWYDALGRLVVSQNAKQQPNNEYSYTRYDDLGRISMVGKAYNTTAMTSTISRDATSFNQTGNALYDWVTNATKTEVTSTHYDDPAITFTGTPFGTAGQENLRGRIANVSYEDTYDGNANTFDHATHYSYDIHGNVKTLVQDNLLLAASFSAEQYKRIDYSYDLISGKVNEVAYQPAAADQFYHRYYYDADNRITSVYTSADEVLWDQDAKYFYYPHGPRARTETGDNKVQGSDHAYTLQGWIKGVNSNTMRTDRDMGKDAYTTGTNLNKWVAMDEYGYSLNYHTKDYQAIGQVTSGPLTQSNMFLAKISAGNDIIDDDYSRELFNGNIRHMVTAIRQFMTTSSTPPQAMVYRYDQLNRIKMAKMFNNVDMTNNNWESTSQNNTDYQESYKYDGNGNILALKREGVGSSMDNLKYYYYNQAGTSTYDPEVSVPSDASNKLAYVTDGVASTNYTVDIDNQSSGNYTYDAIGQLVSDAQEQIATIDWTVYNKIKSITYLSGSGKADLEFRYDAMGNRVEKIVKNPGRAGWETTYYIRDAQGNVMSVYKQKKNALDVPAIFLQEQHIYGSKREGVRQDNVEMSTATAPTVDFERTVGKKNYELSNHLGNVLVTLSDVSVPNDVGSDGTADYYTARVNSASDYTPFGMEMTGRTYTSSNYRYGFNGKEKDDEVKGSGNSYDFGARIYDSRLGRWLSVDPLTKQYASISPYNYVADSPILLGDPDGEKIVDKNGRRVRVKIIENGDGTAYAVYKFKKGTSDKDKQDFLENADVVIREAINTVEGRDVVRQANKCRGKIHINYHYDNGKPESIKREKAKYGPNKGKPSLLLGETSKEGGIIEIDMYEASFNEEVRLFQLRNQDPNHPDLQNTALTQDSERPYNSIDEYAGAAGGHELKHAVEWGKVSMKIVFSKIGSLFRTDEEQYDKEKAIEEKNPRSTDLKIINEMREPEHKTD